MLIPHQDTYHDYAITVWLSNEPMESRSKKSFRCCVCGHLVFEYYDHVRMIMPGVQGFAKAPVVVQCHGILKEHSEKNTRRCKCKYHIQ